MKRYYGVIKDRSTADEFLGNLYLATEGVGGIRQRKGYTAPIKVLSDYSYLEAVKPDAKANLMNRLSESGYIKEAMTNNAEIAILDSLTRNSTAANLSDVENEKTIASIARFAQNLYLVVTPPVENGGAFADGWLSHLAGMKILYIYEYETTTNIENTTIDEETGETTTTITTETETHREISNFWLGHNNSNALAPAIAYEITSTYDYEAIVKLAWCPVDGPSTKEELKSVMSAIDICCYSARIRDRSVIMEHSGSGHSNEVFGAAGPCGGFILHKTKNHGYGITIFNSTDRTPLYTWNEESIPYNKMDESREHAIAVNLGGLGRIINDDKDDNGDYIIKMTALAPIFCPAINDFALTAKWMPQGLHDYSYFDKSGHIHLKQSSNEDTVFFADHGVYLFDGPIENFNLSDRMSPDANPENTVIIKRPKPSSWFTYADRFYAIFDSKDGLSLGSWLNTKNNGEAYDMRYVGTPIINSDGSVRFANNPNSRNSAWCPAVIGSDGNANHGSIMIAVVKFNNLTEWYDPSHTSGNTSRYGLQPYLFGYMHGDDINNSSFNNRYFDGFSQDAYYGSGGYRITDNGGNWDDYASITNYGFYAQLSSGTWYIMVRSVHPRYSSVWNDIYAITSGEPVPKYNDYNKAGSHTSFNNNAFNTRFLLGGYTGFDTSWKASKLEVSRPWDRGQAYMSWDSYSQFNPPNISADFKFVALANASGNNWENLGAEAKNTIIEEIVNRYFGS